MTHPDRPQPRPAGRAPAAPAATPPDTGVHRHACRVHYEDTDLAGIVYYANYLKFIERARSDWVRGLGIDQRRMRGEGRVFAVRRVVADYLRPAEFDDLLEVTTEVAEVGRARIVLWQRVWRGTALLFTAEVTLVCLSTAGRALRLPGELVASAGPVTGSVTGADGPRWRGAAERPDSLARGFETG